MIPQTTDQRLVDELRVISPQTLCSTVACRAKSAGFGDYVDCLTEHGHSCHYALSFGGGYLCRHPDCQRIAENTKANQPASGYAACLFGSPVSAAATPLDQSKWNTGPVRA